MLGISLDTAAWGDTQLLRETTDNNGKKIPGNVPMLGLSLVGGDHREMEARVDFLKENWK